MYCVISLLSGKYLLKPLPGIKHLYSCDCEVGSQICDFKSLLQTEWFRCCSPGRAATSATWRFWLFQYILNYYFFHMFSSHFLEDINYFCRCFEQNNCGGLFLTHEEGTSRSSLGACGYFSDVSWKLIIFTFTFSLNVWFRCSYYETVFQSQGSSQTALVMRILAEYGLQKYFWLRIFRCWMI